MARFLFQSNQTSSSKSVSLAQAPIRYNATHVSRPLALSELRSPRTGGCVRAREHHQNHDH